MAPTPCSVPVTPDGLCCVHLSPHLSYSTLWTCRQAATAWVCSILLVITPAHHDAESGHSCKTLNHEPGVTAAAAASKPQAPYVSCSSAIRSRSRIRARSAASAACIFWSNAA